ncbi:FAD binding domain-containing protein [Bordetella bronchialis]|uniref:FAD binding domain-containing protein n=1 Tax=Bordetella bronchialis TaxID=463025 RepID=UPI003CFBCAEF
MKPSRFVHYVPTSVDQAVIILADVCEQDGRVLAGGQTLVPAMALRLARPAYLVDINRIDELRRLEVRDGRLHIGACVRHAGFHAPVAPGPLGTLLCTVVRHIAHLPIRTRGTFCGSIANADPASEWCLVAATLDAVFEARSLRGTRHIDARDFFHGYMATALAADELLVGASLPVLPEGTRCGFYEFSRRAGDFAQAMALATYEEHAGSGGTVMRNVRIGLGGVEDRPRRMPAAQACLEGEAPHPDTFMRAAEAAAMEAEPVDSGDDERAYRRDLVRAAVRRALAQARGGAAPR